MTMRPEKAEFSRCAVGPGGRGCACCAPLPRDLKRREHRKARRFEARAIEREILEMDADETDI